MAREGLRYELNSAFQKALRDKTAVTLKDLVVGTNGGKQIVDLTVQPLTEPEALQGMVMIVFHRSQQCPWQPERRDENRRTSAVSATMLSELEQELQRLSCGAAYHSRGNAKFARRAQIGQ